MEENNVMDQVVENTDEMVTDIVESDGSGLSKVALGAGIVALGAAAVYGTVTAVKKAVAWNKRRKLKKEAEEAIDNVDSFEEFEDDYDEQVAEFHEIEQK